MEGTTTVDYQNILAREIPLYSMQMACLKICLKISAAKQHQYAVTINPDKL